MTPDLTESRRLLDAGFKLCKLEQNSKQPAGNEWNKHPVKVFDPNATGYGVILSQNGLCSVDPDNYDLAVKVMQAWGFDLDTILDAGVRSLSTRPGSGGRSAFRYAEGLAWVKFSFDGIGAVLELRAASANLQDVIPGLVYADKTGEFRTQKYANCKRLDDAPAVPAEFMAFWLRLSTDIAFRREQQRIAGEAIGYKAHKSVSGAGPTGKSLAFSSPMRMWFNERNQVEDLLLKHGYEQGVDGRFKAPNSEGKAGIRLIPGTDDLWQSDHGSDPLHGTFDAWTIFVLFEHGEDVKAAEAATHALRSAEVVAGFQDLVVPVDDDEPLPMPSFSRDKAGAILATVDNVVKAIGHPMCGMDLRFDQFKDEIVWAPSGTQEWRAFGDEDYVELRIRLEKQAFKPIGRELIRDAVHYVAFRNKFDTAIAWLDGLKWDGKPRVENFMRDCFGVEDTPYHRAVSRYLWTAMAGRIIQPGVKADMVPILVGKQGIKKSTAVAAMAPSMEFFCEISFHEKEQDLARKMRGRLLAEIGELRGLHTRELETIKAFITRTQEDWTPKFKEFNTVFMRRLVFVGTTNQDEFLADLTGNRRWLPMKVNHADVARIEAEREQLWSEAAIMFIIGGVDWQDAEVLAEAAHEEHTMTDVWADAIIKWLDEEDVLVGDIPNTRPHIRVSDVLKGALGFEDKHIKQQEEKRAASVLRQLGYLRKKVRINAKTVWAFVPAGSPTGCGAGNSETPF